MTNSKQKLYNKLQNCCCYLPTTYSYLDSLQIAPVEFEGTDNSSIFKAVSSGGDLLTEWPGGLSGGDYDRRNVSIPEPIIESDGTYRCPVCNQGFPARQDYDDHYVNDHTKEKVQKNYTSE